MSNKVNNDMLVFKNVRKRFGDTIAVNDLSFTCKKGEITVLLGPTGAGKTTTLRLIAGLEKLDEGEIYIDNINVENTNPENREIAMFFESYALYSHLTVRENIEFPLKAPIRRKKYSKEEIAKRTIEVARLLEIEPLLDRKPYQLSGGQKQRTALGRALIRKPKLFLLDEPIAHLDAVLRNRMRGEMKKIFTQLDATVVYVTHDYREALSMGDKILLINNGQVVQIGNSEDIYDNMVNMFAAKLVGDPPINFINGTLKSIDNKCNLDINGSLIELKGDAKNLKNWLQKNIILGIRPHDLKILKSSIPNSIPAEVLAIEPISSSYEITVKLPTGEMFKVKSKEKPEYSLDNVWLEIGNKVHLFDPESQNAIFHGGDYCGTAQA